MNAHDPPLSTGLQTASSLAEFGELFRRKRKALGMAQSDIVLVEF